MVRGQAPPAFGWLHLPEGGGSRGGVVICPPLGREYLLGHFALRLLAEALAEAGFSALRFDYDGTGDSAGVNRDPGRVEAWLGTVRSATARIRAEGVEDVSVVGVRFGAVLASSVASSDGHVDQLVLWDPCSSGREFLKQEQAMVVIRQRQAGMSGVDSDGAVETPGIVYDAETAADMRALAISDCPRPLARRVLVLLRPDRPRNPKLLDRSLGAESVSCGEATGQAELLDRGSPFQELPTRPCTTS